MHKQPGTPAHVGRRVLTPQQALGLGALRPDDLPHYGKVARQIFAAKPGNRERRKERRESLRREMGKVL